MYLFFRKNGKVVLLAAALLGSMISAPVLYARFPKDNQPAVSKPEDSTGAMANMPMSQMQPMRERMRKIHELMDRIQATQDLGERQKLMQEQVDLMQKNMEAMMSTMPGIGGDNDRMPEPTKPGAIRMR